MVIFKQWFLGQCKKFLWLGLLIGLVYSLSGCDSNSATPTSVPTSEPSPTLEISATTPTTPANTPTSDPNLTKVALAIATQNAIGATPRDLRTMTALAGEVNTQNAVVQNGGALPTPTPLPTPIPTPQPVSPLPAVLPTLAQTISNTLSAKQINQLNFQAGSTSATSAKNLEPVQALALSPNGKTLALAGTHQIWLWETASGKIMQTVYTTAGNSFERGAASLAWSPDGKQLAAGGLHGVVLVWQIDQTSNQLRNGPLRLEPVEGSADFGGQIAVAFSPDSTSLAAIDSAGYITVWDSQSFMPKAAFATTYAGHITWSPDSKSLADEFLDIGYLGDNKLYPPAFDASINGTSPYNLAWSPDGKLIAVSSQDFDVLLAQAPAPNIKSGIVKLVQAAPAVKYSTPSTTATRHRPMSWSLNSQMVAIGNLPTPGKVTIWQASTLKSLAVIDVSNQPLTSLIWFNGTLLITGDSGGTVKFWQLNNH